jgi:hypothetical protein
MQAADRNDGRRFLRGLEAWIEFDHRFLQTLHNDALGMGWIPSPILPRKLRPKMTKKANAPLLRQSIRN